MDKSKLFEYRRSIFGSKNPNWKPDTPEFKRYQTIVWRLTRKTYKLYEDEINPNKYKRTYCGVDNGYQLDHIISIKEGYLSKIPPETIADRQNLQMLTWQDNRKKGSKCYCI